MDARRQLFSAKRGCFVLLTFMCWSLSFFWNITMVHSEVRLRLLERLLDPGTRRQQRYDVVSCRGGESTTAYKTLPEIMEMEDAYTLLAEAVRAHFISVIDGDSIPEVNKLISAFKSMSSAQKTFKGLDGAAHEAYQRTHSSAEVDITVSGRAKRSAARTGAAADGLGASELCELIEYPERFDLSSANGTLVGREVLLNLTDATTIGNSSVKLLVFYEASYIGGRGVQHGGIDDLTDDQRQRRGAKGRLLVVIGDDLSRSLGQTLRILGHKPRHVEIGHDFEVASVQPSLHSVAATLLTILEPILRSYNESAIHFTGRSLSGGIASLAAAILEGDIPMARNLIKSASVPSRKRRQRDAEPLRSISATSLMESNNKTISEAPLQGLGKGRTSAISLGAPPCLSSNVRANYATSILYGDDIVCRISPESLERFFRRTRRALQREGILGRRLNWMADAVLLATSNLQSHAVGSDGAKVHLAIPGRAYLIRPRRLGGQSSMHEVGSNLKSGRRHSVPLSCGSLTMCCSVVACGGIINSVRTFMASIASTCADSMKAADS